MSDDIAAIHAILAAQDEAWARGDATGFSRDVADDVVFTNVVGMFLVGRAGFDAQHAHIFATFYKGSALRQKVERIAFPRPDVAIVNTFTEVTGFGELPPAFHAVDGMLNTRLEQVLVRGEAGWRVVAFHNVIVDPAAASASPSDIAG